MKKLLSLILLFSTFAGAQVYQTFSMHLVRIEGDLEAFEKVQTMYMQKVAQEASCDATYCPFLLIKQKPLLVGLSQFQ